MFGLIRIHKHPQTQMVMATHLGVFGRKLKLKVRRPGFESQPRHLLDACPSLGLDKMRLGRKAVNMVLEKRELCSFCTYVFISVQYYLFWDLSGCLSVDVKVFLREWTCGVIRRPARFLAWPRTPTHPECVSLHRLKWA